MPGPAFTWSTYEVLVAPPEGRLRAAAEAPDVGAAPQAVVVELPDLTDWPQPLDKARILLESAAEVEHALMVQYLYAAYSLKDAREVTDAAQQIALDDTSAESWPQLLLSIAREEMGHLMTVQNLLLALGLAPNLEREDFPPRKDLYPFALHLEPLSQRSLAKYVLAEAPADAEGIEDIVELVRESAGTTINRVGVLYGLLGLVFSTEGDLRRGASGHADWDALMSELSLAAYQQSAPQSWHLPDGAIDPRSASYQADPDDWQVGGLRVHRVTDRAAAVQAIRDVGEQGEGPTSEGEQSHFGRFLSIYRGDGGMPAFPAAGDWVATRDVPTDPKVDVDISEPRTRRWAELVDLRYALLLGFVEHYLLTGGHARRILTAWIFAEMRSRVGFVARELTTMPRAGAATTGPVAAVPFTLPSVLHLADDAAGWALHRERTEAAIMKVEEMQAADHVDEADSYLVDLLASDRARLVFIEAGATGPETSFARDIMPLFRSKDVKHMIANSTLDLSQYESVREESADIARRIASRGRPMPPPPDQRWTKVQIALFEQWIAEGHPD
jgi:hypothetical protein